MEKAKKNKAKIFFIHRSPRAQRRAENFKRVKSIKLKMKGLLTLFVRAPVRRTMRTRTSDLLRGGGGQGRRESGSDETTSTKGAASSHP